MVRVFFPDMVYTGHDQFKTMESLPTVLRVKTIYNTNKMQMFYQEKALHPAAGALQTCVFTIFPVAQIIQSKASLKMWT